MTQNRTEFQTIQCPKCKAEIPLTDVFTRQIEEKIRTDYEGRLKQETTRIKLDAEKRSQESASIELMDLRAQLVEKNTKLKKAEEKELELRARDLQGGNALVERLMR